MQFVVCIVVDMLLVLAMSNKSAWSPIRKRERKDTQRQIFSYSGSWIKAQKIVRSDHLNTLEFNSPLVSEFFAWVSTLTMAKLCQYHCKGKSVVHVNIHTSVVDKWCGDGPSFTLATCCKRIPMWGGKAHPARQWKHLAQVRLIGKQS